MAVRLAYLVAFLRDVRRELKAVQWPSRQQTGRFTILIVAVVVVVAIATGALDYALTTGVERFLLR